MTWVSYRHLTMIVFSLQRCIQGKTSICVWTRRLNFLYFKHQRSSVNTITCVWFNKITMSSKKTRPSDVKIKFNLLTYYYYYLVSGIHCTMIARVMSLTRGYYEEHPKQNQRRIVRFPNGSCRESNLRPSHLASTVLPLDQ